jgi:hypothetical protein
MCFSISPRAKVRPFEEARSVFAALPDALDNAKVETKVEGQEVKNATINNKTEPDILDLCNLIPLEVVGLGKVTF